MKRMGLGALAFFAAAAAPPPQVLELGREATATLLSGDAASLEARFTGPMLQLIRGKGGAARFGEEIRAVAGAELEVLREAVFEENGGTVYYRESRFERVPRLTAQWVFAPDGRISGAWIGPSPTPAPTRFDRYRTKAPLRLPFGPVEDGAWYVTWGGRDAITNYHVIARDQRFAYDFIATRGGSPFAGDGRRNEDHVCWDLPVLAPAAGRIVAAIGSIPDNARPGYSTKGVPAPGNHVVIDHGRGEYSLIAHFRFGSLAVREGERVETGALLGRCGNSGNSSQPHIHYHLQTGPAFGAGEGLPAFFNRYVADGTPVKRGEPQRGQLVSPGAPAGTD